MKTRLTYEDDNSRKFWEITLKGGAYLIQYGRLGTRGQSRTKDFPSADAARKAYDEQIAAKLKKGYVQPGRSDAKAKTRTQGPSTSAKKSANKRAKSQSSNQGELSRSKIKKALDAAYHKPSACVQMLVKHQKASKRSSSSSGPGFDRVTFKDFRTRLAALPEEFSLVEALSDDRRAENDDSMHYFDYRNLLEAEILKGFYKNQKDRRDEHANAVKLKEKTRVVRGDFHVKDLQLDEFAFLIVTGSLLVDGRLELIGDDCRLLVFGNVEVKGDVVSYSYRSSLFICGSLRISGIFVSGMNTLVGNSLQAGALICRSQGVIHVTRDFKIKLLFGFDEHSIHVEGSSNCSNVFPLDWPIVNGPPAARIRSTPPKKLFSFLRKAINWKALKGEMDDFVELWDDEIEYSELEEALEDYLREKRKHRGTDVLRA